jgi:hypothetical protein
MRGVVDPLDSTVRGVGDSPYHRYGESVTPRFFEYEYLHKFEAKIGTARKEPISAKTPENPPHCHVPLRGWCL